MYIAMNRFKVLPHRADAFEQVWLSRESYLHELPGFVEFHLLRGPVKDDHQLFSSYTLWATKDDFVNWTKSEQFARSHRRTGSSEPMTLGHPEFEGFDVIQTLTGSPVGQAA